MKIKIQCPHCGGSGTSHAHPDLHDCACGWCRGFGMLVEATRVCTDCVASQTDCPYCGGTHQRVVVYPAHSRFELDLLPDQNYLEEES